MGWVQKLFLHNVFFIFFYMPLVAQTPEWVSSYGITNSYPDQTHITGFGMAQISKDTPVNKAIAMAESFARADLSQKVIVQVNSIINSFEDETNGSYSSQFSLQSESTSSLELVALQSEHHITANMVYVLSSVKKDLLKEQYQEKMNGLLDQFLQISTQAKKSLEAGSKDLALKQLMSARPVYSEILNTWTILHSLGEASVWKPEEIRGEINLINEQINNLLNRPISSLDDAAWWLTTAIGSEAEKSYTVDVSAITYQNSGISSEFANYMRQLLKRRINNSTSWSVVEPNANRGQKPTHIMTGTFWDRGEDVHVLINTREIEGGEIIASTEATISRSVIEESGLELLPDNYEQAVKDLQAMNQNKGDNRGLQLEVWTAKGTNSLVYEEGELLEVSLQVNLPSYIRILYHLNDGTRVLLVDSHYINNREVNKPYTLPYQFECVAPFGVEMMQVIAQSEPFQRVQTKEIDGIPYLAEDLDKFLSNTRGFKIKKQEAQQAEEVLTITTMAGNK